MHTEAKTPTCETIPQELKDRAQWVPWDWGDTNPNTGNPRKKFFQAHNPNKFAKSDDPTTWTTFDKAWDSYERNGMAGIAYVFSDDDPYAGVDFDDCLTEDGTLKDWARPWLESLNESYTEISPSGTGIKVIVTGSLDKGTSAKSDDMAFEIYSFARFWCMTGHVFEGRSVVRDGQSGLTVLQAYIESLKEKERAKRQAEKAKQTTHSNGNGHATQAPLRWPDEGSPAYQKRITAWVDSIIQEATEIMQYASEGHLHRERLRAGRIIGGLVPKYLSEYDAVTTLYNARPPKANYAQEEKAIEDAVRLGMSQPWQEPPPVTPVFNEAGIACCPDHPDIPLSKCKHGYKCDVDSFHFWWDGYGYTPPPGAHPRARTPQRMTTDCVPPSAAPAWENLSYESSRRERKRYKFLDDDDLANLPTPEWLARYMVPKNSKMLIYGPPGCGKSFVTISIGSALAYNGYNVLYICAEAVESNKTRRAAWLKHHTKQTYYNKPRNEQGVIRFINGAVNFFDRTATYDLLDSIKEQGLTFDIIFVDTLAKSMEGGDENVNRDMSVVMANTDIVRQETGATVCLVHHSGKGNATTERGGGALLGDVYIAFNIQKDSDDIVSITPRKVRDFDERSIPTFKFKFVSVDTGYRDSDGEVVTSAILLPAHQVADRGMILDERHWRTLDVLDALQSGTGSDVTLREIATDMKIESSQASRLLARLVCYQYVKKEPKEKGKGYYWEITDAGRNALANNKVGLPPGGTKESSPFGFDIRPKQTHSAYAPEETECYLHDTNGQYSASGREITQITRNFENNGANNTATPHQDGEITEITPMSTPLRGGAHGCVNNGTPLLTSEAESSANQNLNEIHGDSVINTDFHGSSWFYTDHPDRHDLFDGDHDSDSASHPPVGVTPIGQPTGEINTDSFMEESMPRHPVAASYKPRKRKPIQNDSHAAYLASIFGQEAVDAAIQASMDCSVCEPEVQHDQEQVHKTEQPPTPENPPAHTLSCKSDDTPERPQEGSGGAAVCGVSNDTSSGRSAQNGDSGEAQDACFYGNQVEWSDGVPVPTVCEVHERVQEGGADELTDVAGEVERLMAFEEYFTSDTVRDKNGKEWVRVYDERTDEMIGQVMTESQVRRLVSEYLMMRGEL